MALHRWEETSLIGTNSPGLVVISTVIRRWESHHHGRGELKAVLKFTADAPLLIMNYAVVAAREHGVVEPAHFKESDFTVLDVLHREGFQRPTVLARRTDTHLATMTGVLSRLEQQGWIENQTDSNDRDQFGAEASRRIFDS